MAKKEIRREVIHSYFFERTDQRASPDDGAGLASSSVTEETNQKRVKRWLDNLS